MRDVSSINDDIAELPCNGVSEERFGQLMAFIAAVQFLTRVSISPHKPVSSTALARCPVYFPLVGALIGLFTSTVLGIAGQVWPVWLAIIVALTAEAILTGAFHEDAVADFCDAFGGGWTREETLAILKDSRIGTYGALGLGLAVALRAGAMLEVVSQNGLDHWLIWSSAVVASSAVGRWVIVLAMFSMPPVASRDSLSRHMSQHLGIRDLLTATAWMIAIVCCLAAQLPYQSVLAAGLLVPAVSWFLRLVKLRLGGSTGDCLGCIGYVSQVLVLLSVAARWR